MKYSLAGLMIAALVGPPLLAGVWFSMPPLETERPQWTADIMQLFGGMAAVVCCAAAYFKSQKPALLLAAVAALIALLGWEVSVLIRLAP